MKRLTLVPLLIASLFLPLSCEKKAQGTTDEQAFTTVTTPPKELHYGYALRVAGLYSIADGKGTWQASTFLGEKLTIEGEKVEASINGYDYDLTKVSRSSGETSWIIDMTMGADGELAVITGTDNIVLYTGPQAATATGTSLDPMQILVVHPDSLSGKYIRASLYIPNKEDPAKIGSYYGYNDRTIRYVRVDDYSTRESDVQSAILYQMAQSSENEVKKAALLQAALDDYGDSVFAAAIRSSLSGGDDETAIETINLEMTVIGTATSVYAKPAEDSVRIGGIQEGELVTAVARSTETLPFQGNSDYWYRIEEPLSGWIFGGYLTEYNPVGEEDGAYEDWQDDYYSENDEY